MIWNQCICSLWSSNSFHVTHQEPFLVLLSPTLSFYPPPVFLDPLPNFPPLPLQLQHEKAELEQHLEQEQEFQVNKLMKKIKKMENETISKQLTLEQVWFNPDRLLWAAKENNNYNNKNIYIFFRHDISFDYFRGLWLGQTHLRLTISIPTFIIFSCSLDKIFLWLMHL